jgi:hypothetical protein
MLDKSKDLWYNISTKNGGGVMKRTMTVEDFKVWKDLASKYNLAWELIDRNENWVCVYIGA